MPPPAEGFAARFVLGPALRTQPDRRLVTLVREGYETAFEEIVRRYGRPLTRYAAAIVGSRGEDVTQDAFSKALLALRRDSAEIELRPWLFRIVRNTALNDLRDSPPTPELLAEAIVGGEGPAEEFEKREELADLMRRLRSLPESQRAAIVMRELEGLSHEEIANALGLSDGAARQAIYRARQTLRDGFGMLLPLPLLRLLGDHGGDMAAAGAGVGAGGTAMAGGAVGGAGAGVALKAATVLLAGAIGAGVAVQHDRHAGQADALAPASAGPRDTARVPHPGGGSSGGSNDSLENGGRGTDARRHGSSQGDEGRHRHGSGGSSGGHGDGPGPHGGFVRTPGGDDGGHSGSNDDGGDRHGGRSGGGSGSGSGGSGEDGGSSGQSGHGGSSGSGDGSPSFEGGESGSGGSGGSSGSGGGEPSSGSSGPGPGEELPAGFRRFA
jgi:RNA polymerase sigma factor (sigma-70 family)